ncbi:DEAD/DEAH box helicase [Bacillus sp. HMF5848]|uniref:DEAD/DEAH box helicase n=1 Tax=Bacillus sp. HMF5848 TaxID=2495421 RepID=UPI000F77CFC4|nr:DEAD/DEAH box helicase [Bacillus sp. HMF5848]RSK28879.1 DEAD/DEAH box helicase [Bacillus sp. HMF5848]
MRTQALKVYARWHHNTTLLISVTDDAGLPVKPEDWRPLLFSWHDSSFYGTFVEIVDTPREQGILLDAWQAAELFAGETWNSFVQWTWDDTCQKLQTVAPQIVQIIAQGDFAPTLEGWRALDNSDEFLNQWLSEAVKAYIATDGEVADAWTAIQEAYPLLMSEAPAVVDEHDYLEKIGWLQDNTPFTVGLRLEEPDEDEEPWRLRPFFRSKEDDDDVYDFLPNEWHDFSERLTREQTIWRELVPWIVAEDGIKEELSEFEAWEFLTVASETLVAAGVEILLPSWWQAIRDAKLSLKAKVRSSVGSRPGSIFGMQSLVNFDWRVSTQGGAELSEDEFRKLVEQKRRLVYIRGQWIKLDPEFLKTVQAVLRKADKEGLHVRDVLAAELGAGSVFEGIEDAPDIEIEANPHILKMLQQLSQLTDIPELPVPEELHGELRPYQKQGYEWLSFLRGYGFGACLADDMGLGKTIQTITYLLHVKQTEGFNTPALIVAPTSVLGNWQKEIETFAPSLNVRIHYGSTRAKGADNFPSWIEGADVILTSYTLAQLDFEELSEVEWQAICLDEAQNIKNAYTKQSRAIRKLKTKHAIALTGTPMENRLTELWSIFDFINPGYLGSLQRFQRKFVAPIEKDNDKEKISQVQRLIRPFLLRRTKKDPEVELNLPDKQEQKEFCPLTVEQASLYEQLVNDTFAQIEKLNGFERRGLILKMIGQLKQVCNHPALYLKEARGARAVTTAHVERSNKLVKLLDLVASIQEREESCLIFTQYIGMGEMIVKLLEDKFGADVEFLNGSVPKQTRDRMIEDFQAGQGRVLVLSLKAGGTGLNLTAANHVIHYDRWWNPAVENQATDRAYRIGQKRFVHVHKLITTGTLEEKIDFMLEKKQSLNDQIIQSEQWITELDTDELRELIMLT